MKPAANASIRRLISIRYTIQPADNCKRPFRIFDDMNSYTNAQIFLTTERLIIRTLTVEDADFIFRLLNTEGWIRFIGNRNITSHADAISYIQKILSNPNLTYWVVQLNKSGEAVGIVTYIKRDYLEHRDIGFAFLPEFSGNGYAYEATHAVLQKLIREHNSSHVLATTVPANSNSIKLLKKLGLAFEKEIQVENETLHLYGGRLIKMDLSSMKSTS